VVEDSHVCAPVPFVPFFPVTVGAGTDFDLYSRTVTMRGCTLTNPPDQVVPVLVKLSTHYGGTDTRIPGIPVRVFLFDHQGVAGADYQLFYAEQHADASFPANVEILPAPVNPGDSSRFGGHTAGETNAQSLAAFAGRAGASTLAAAFVANPSLDHGRCFGDEVASEGAVLEPGGFVGCYRIATTDPED
jgi:hypothetical protein